LVTVSLSPTNGWAAWPWSVGWAVAAGTALLRADAVVATTPATASATITAVLHESLLYLMSVLPCVIGTDTDCLFSYCDGQRRQTPST
jgi:hypothetical protein